MDTLVVLTPFLSELPDGTKLKICFTVADTPKNAQEACQIFNVWVPPSIESCSLNVSTGASLMNYSCAECVSPVSGGSEFEYYGRP